MEKPVETAPAAPPAASAAKPAAPAIRLGWPQAWQVPTLALAVTLLLSGVVMALRWAPKPDFSSPLRRAERMIEQAQYEEAIERLNTDVFPYIATNQLNLEQRRKFHTLMGRALYLGQESKGVDRAENHRNIVGQYAEAEALNATLEPRDVAYIAAASIALGELDSAQRRAESLPASERARQIELYRRLVEAAVRTSRDDQRAMELLSGLLNDPELPREMYVWALGRQVELQLTKGYAEEVINRLLRELPTLEDASNTALGELYTILAEAYMETGSIAQAQRQVDRAEPLVADGTPAAAKLGLMRARIEEAKGGTEAARDRYAAVLDTNPPDAIRLASMLGLGETRAALNQLDESIAAYTDLVRELKRGVQSREVTRERVGQSLMARFQDREDAGNPAAALRYGNLAESLYGVDRAPPEVLLGIARVHRQLANETIAASIGPGVDVTSMAQLDPATRAQARGHLVTAGQYYQQHAARMLLAGDDPAYSESLWQAGDAFDRAGDQDAALSVFQQYAQRAGDPRQAEAQFRLAQAYMARGDFDPAIAIFRNLIEGRDRRGAEPANGRWADASYVPLARAYLMQAKPENEPEVERLLSAVVAGTVFGTEAPGYREALEELGSFYYRKGRYERAIESFDAMMTRYGDDPATAASRFRLADSYRLSALQADKKLEEAMPDSDRQRLKALRDDRLTRALGLFEQYRRETEARDARRRTELDELYLRNAYFYLGDCAFQLADYDSAIRYYDAARERYPRQPASLVAMIQIVNAYVRQGDLKRAAAANEKAKRFYASLPAEVWNDKDLPMTRSDWERWLDSTFQLSQAGGGAAP